VNDVNPPDTKDRWKLAAVAGVGILMAALGSIIASNFVPTSEPVGVVAKDLSTTTTDSEAVTTTASVPIAIATGTPSSSTITNPAAPAAIEVSETVVDFGNTSTSDSLQLSNTGGTAATWTIRSSDPGVTTSPTDGELGPGEVAEIGVTLDRDVIAEGELGAVLTFSWGGNEVQLFVQGVQTDNPVIIGPKSSPSTVIAQTGAGCDPSKTTITVRVKDTSEIAAVIVRWSNGVSVVETPMTAVDAENYTAVIGPFVEVVSPNVKIVAMDVYDNAGGAPVPLDVIACP
jgi:hypothetical protein